MTPLMWGTYNNNPLVTEFLLGQRADCEEKDRDGMTAMHWWVELASFLREKGALDACIRE